MTGTTTSSFRCPVSILIIIRYDEPHVHLLRNEQLNILAENPSIHMCRHIYTHTRWCVYITTSDSNEETNRYTALSLSLLRLEAVMYVNHSATAAPLQWNAKKLDANFQGRASTSKGFYNSIQSRQMEEVRSKRLFDRKRKKRKNIFLLTTGTVVQRTMLHTYVLTALYEPRVLHHRARCLFLVLYGSNRRLIGYSGVLRSDYAVLVVCPEYLQNGLSRHGASIHGTASMTNVNSIGRVT